MWRYKNTKSRLIESIISGTKCIGVRLFYLNESRKSSSRSAVSADCSAQTGRKVRIVPLRRLTAPGGAGSVFW